MRTHILCPLVIISTAVLAAPAAEQPSSNPFILPGTRPAAPINNVDDEAFVFDVRRYGKEETDPNARRAGLGDRIEVRVVGMDAWLKLIAPDLPGPRGSTPNPYVLVPIINGIRLAGVYPEWIETVDAQVCLPDGACRPVKATHLRFLLERDDRSKDAWTRLLNQPVTEREVDITVGFEAGPNISTHVLRGRTDTARFPVVTVGQSGGPRQPITSFRLVVLPWHWGVAGGGVVLLSLLLFGWLAKDSDLVRDTTAPLRPDGRRPYSMARVQMAFWFFLVLSAYLLLWIITRAQDTITGTVLGLIGISAGTALGAAIVDAGKPQQSDDGGGIPAAVDLNGPRKKVVMQLEAQLQEAQRELDAAKDGRSQIAPADAAALAANDALIAAALAKLNRLEHQLTYFKWPRWRGVMNDLLAEGGSISFHRFHMFVWTVVLGIIFVAHVLRDLAMPDFSPTLLGLMGISATTYVGFKLPQAQGRPG